MKLELRFIEAPLRAPFVSASGSLNGRRLLHVTLTGDDGVAGHGEAAPLVELEAARGAIEDCRALLAESDGADREPLLAECRRLAVLPAAVSAIDLALWDLAARRAAAPVWRLLGGSSGDPIAVNATIAAPDRAQASAAADRARAEGFECVKVKVGLGDDAGRLAAVRAALGPSIAIRLDANGAWSVDEAIASLRALEPVGLELCEEPVFGLEELEAVSSATAIPISLDESAALPGALDRRVADAVCLKVSSSGGISGLLDAAARARLAGYRVYVASMLDGPLGIAAALHACAAIRPELPCGLATLDLFDRPNPLPASRGRIAIPTGPGLGTGLDDWYHR
ncbi:MAG TPA: mandelate racemase/muconate lactonizing enzyme family protein [Solirubrobacteraceae bacterium]|nr:mandelate racemase/muconate lactonizing enzyme family protein [Solirubrobacteraceae bacterium]